MSMFDIDGSEIQGRPLIEKAEAMTRVNLKRRKKDAEGMEMHHQEREETKNKILILLEL